MTAAETQPAPTSRVRRIGLSPLTGARGALVAFLSGALSAACLPPIHLVPVLLLAVPALLALIGAQSRMSAALRIGFCFGFGQHLLGLYWVTEAILIEAARFWWFVPIAVPLLAAVLALFVAAPCALAWRAPEGLPRLLVLAGTWGIADLAREFVLTGFPWNPLASAWEIPGSVGDILIQPAAVVGAPGMTMLTLLLAGSPTLVRPGRLAGVAGLAAWIAFGLWRTSWLAPPDTALTAIIVQGNIPQGEKVTRAGAIAGFEKYVRMTRDGLAPLHGASAVVVWPETASLFPLDSDPGARAAIAAAADGAPVLAGSLRFNEAGKPLNSLVALDGRGGVAGVYDKSHLVPFGEYQPPWIPLPVQIIPGGGFAAGGGPATLHVPGLPPVGALICYEVIFPGQVVDAASRPDWIVNITNDAWFGNSTGPRQHLAAVRLRAVEEGLPIVRAANTGISVVFDAFGRERVRLGMNTSGTIAAAIPSALPATPFARWGLAIPASLALAMIAASIGFARIRPNRPDQS